MHCYGDAILASLVGRRQSSEENVDKFDVRSPTCGAVDHMKMEEMEN